MTLHSREISYACEAKEKEGLVDHFGSAIWITTFQPQT